MGKRYFELYDAVINPLNVWAAYKQAALGKRYKLAAAYFEYDLEKNLIEIEQERPNEYEQQHRFSLLPITSKSYLQPEYNMFKDVL